MRDIRELSRRKRHGGELSAEELGWIVEEYTAGGIEDAPMAAWLMAVCWAGMTEAETWALTEAMMRSGEVVDLSGMERPTVDKHSTGGVGDKVSLVACPIAAACGVCVAKLSGRGLGHTGGTIDKLEAIPGLSTDLSAERFLAQAREIGLVIAAQSADLAPADGKIYALRDATGTVDSPALIAASIMSKKLAAGAEAIILEVTVGSGAFVTRLDEARALAELMIAIGERAGRAVGAVITAMDQPLGRTVGNAVEVEEAVAVLNGEGPQDVREASVVIGAWMLVGAGLAEDFAGGVKIGQAAIESGEAHEKFLQMVAAQGGDTMAVKRPLLGWRPEVTGEVTAERSGFVSRLDARQVGYAALSAGAGRRRKGDELNPAAGVRLATKVGDTVKAGDVLGEVMAASEAQLAEAATLLRGAYVIGDEAPPAREVMIEQMPPAGDTQR